MRLELFSFNERRVIDCLKRGKRMSIIEITEKLYDIKSAPKANNTIGCAIRRINLKCSKHKLSWFVDGVGGGRGGKTVWLNK